MLMSSAEYRESLRRYNPRVFVDGRAVESVADEPAFAPGLAAIGITYDFALREEYRPLMIARQATSGKIGQSHAAHQRDEHRPAVQARGGAAGLPGERLRATLSRRTTRSMRLPGDAADRRPAGNRLSPAVRHLPAPGPGRGPDARRRHDRRQGRPRRRPHSRPTRTSTCTSSSAGRTGSSSAAPRRS